MGYYKAKSVNSTTFTLTQSEISLGELIYSKWYSFTADILLADHSKYELMPKDFWDSTIELKKNEEILLHFKMGWKGILINTKFDYIERSYLLKLKGFLNNKYVLLDTNENELLAVESEFKWVNLRFDYTIATSEEFDNYHNKELFLLTIIHCINYHITMIAAAV